MNSSDDLKKHIEIYEKHHHFIFFSKEEKGIFSSLYSSAGIVFVVALGLILLFYFGIKLAWWFFALAALICSEKAGHKEGYKYGYETG